MFNINNDQIIEKFKLTVEEYRKKIGNGDVKQAQKYVKALGIEIEATSHFIAALKSGKRALEQEISKIKGE
ncbi:hypothetical protein P8917_09545 [Bacillus atrophaeus]|uniref:hypothetical protein n=1 Tax=Bacillus atrophaeus TaxID=1452 RepID=UPI0022812BFB|nr:hypothetical protein [Bacillus atrophaeus]MCY8466966.1 hypothetical protein [Bacillus atrophaeus]MCY8475693.1 hypothetical protein [Bacillus atrophaeus]MCY8499403.1 hypothetical protein [Bacillus atrophaeus]MCY8814549.1 hypothetical protein [Bacillus atrophaeus]MCY8823167.1 hypothetical protein [Bacillus atrophaeus]